MTIELSPALEAIIQQRLKSEAFQNVEDVLLDALQVKSLREEWLQANKAAIQEKIARGIDQLDRGEGIGSDDLRACLESRKAAWLSDPAG